jgi:hypothetical protein
VLAADRGCRVAGASLGDDSLGLLDERKGKAAMTYHPTTTALLLVDPYNDFMSEGGKAWSRAKTIAEEVKLLDHLRVLVRVARDMGIKIYFVPHHRWEPGDYVKWDHPTPYQLAGAE